MKTIVAMLAIVGLLSGPALADLLGNPYDGVVTTGMIAQDFGSFAPDALDIWVVSDFETTTDYYLHEVYSEGWETTSAGRDGDGALFNIYDGLPWDGGSIVLAASDGYDTLDSTGTIGADFGGQMLEAGTYYIAFQSLRDVISTGGNSIIRHTSLGNNNDWSWNPGEGHGYLFRPIGDADGNPIDVNWQLTTVPVPEPTSLALFALAGLWLRRR